jgi:uncharacterized protein YbaP (TraB family)
MKHLKIVLALSLSLMFISNTQAQTQKEENSFLYSITGNGLKDTSYLFGTVHLQCADDFKIKDKVLNAIKSSNEICFEIDMKDPKTNEIIMESIINGEKLSEQLDSLELIKIDSLLQSKLGMTAKTLDMYSLNLIAPLLGISSVKCEDKSYYESEILAIAEENNINTRGIESIQFQLESLRKSADKQTVLSHIYTTAYYEVMPKVLDAYKIEDLNTLTEICFGANFMTPQEVKYLLEIRNKNWIKLMPKMMKNKSMFFAFGAAHLGTDIGIIDLLQKQGYIVTPIYN